MTRRSSFPSTASENRRRVKNTGVSAVRKENEGRRTSRFSGEKTFPPRYGGFECAERFFTLCEFGWYRAVRSLFVSRIVPFFYGAIFLF